MISYEPFWQTIRRKNISTYQLIYEYGILPDTIQRLRSGKTITTKTLNTLCSVIDCPIPWFTMLHKKLYSSSVVANVI